jgi:GH25 family lysozyme M1 (1,4-beta-N-acetylmuramidase)
MQSRNPQNVKGIDVSHHNGSIDWPSVAADGVKFVYIKATEGITWADPMLDANYKGAKSVGLKVGFYHFAHPSKTNAAAEAQHFIAAVKPYKVDLPHVLDIEVASGLSAVDITAFSAAWLDAVKVLGKEAIYTGESFAANLQGQLGQYPLWVAHYGVNQPANAASWQKWSLFQYDDKGTVAGINGNVDMDEMDADYYNALFPPVKPKRFIHLPATVGTWRAYPLDQAPVVGNEVGYLYPKKYHGLRYEILANPQKDVYTIQSARYGKVNIYGAPSTGAVIKGA